MSDLKAKFMLAVVVLFFGGVMAASAQIKDGTVLKFTATSEFAVKDKTFAPGEYTIQRVPSTAASASLLVLRDRKGHALVFDTILDRNAPPSKDTELVFDNIDGTNVLAKIIVQGESGANEVPRTTLQRQAIAKGVPVKRIVMTPETGF